MILTKEELLKVIDIDSRPECFRKGQWVFNFIDKNYGVSRDVQFIDGVDCFYDDSVIDQFLECTLVRINNTTTPQVDK